MHSNRALRGRGLAAALVLLAGMAWGVPADAAPTRTDGGIRFTYTDPNASSVYWAGEFNGWNGTANPMTRGDDGSWSIVVALPAGEHQYKFVVDGEWFADPGNPVTAGDFGNSAVTVAGDGSLVAMQATSNTAYSPKIFFGGRFIGLYQAAEQPENRRFELRRPGMDIDLNFDIRISDVLNARFLLNINSEREDIEFFKTRLNLDRGKLLFTQPKFSILAYDNEDAGTWDDPLNLVGNVGIYGYAYGFGRQGFRFDSKFWDMDGELHYADNFEPGGTAFPVFTPDEIAQFSAETIDSLVTRPSGSVWELVPGQTPHVTRVNVSDNNEDMFAGRVKREFFSNLTLGLLGRSDRGYNLGSTVLQTVTGPTSFRQISGDFAQEWYAAGGEADWKLPGNFRVFGEYLRGRQQLTMMTNSLAIDFDAVTDSAGVASVTPRTSGSAAGEHVTTDDSNRFRFGGEWQEAHGDVLFRADVEYQDHDYGNILPGLENAMTIWRVQWDRNWRYYLNRQVRTGLAIEAFDFDYKPGTPWNFQLWFPTANFWLEHDEHVVSYDRLTMLGGNDAVTIKPSIAIPIPEVARIPWIQVDDALFEYEGTFNTVSLSTEPRYIESIFKLRLDLLENLRLDTNSRWAVYRDPRLGLHDSFVNHFAELTYSFAPKISVALGLGVDPFVLDRVVNEYRNIGRDLFLFERGANGGTAETDYFSLATKIPEAERALRSQRRVQVEAIVHF